jgi:hypothetical protein
LADISLRLDEEYGLSPGDVAVVWRSGVDGDRVKNLGKVRVKVQVREGGREEKILSINVVRLKEGMTA